MIGLVFSIYILLCKSKYTEKHFSFHNILIVLLQIFSGLYFFYQWVLCDEYVS